MSDPHKIKIAIVGGRDLRPEETIKTIMEILPEEWAIVSGCCPTGVDFLAEAEALRTGREFVGFPANWEKYGKSAGPRRNQEMVNYCDAVIAIPSENSSGTYDAIYKALKAHKPVLNIGWNSNPADIPHSISQFVQTVISYQF